MRRAGAVDRPAGSRVRRGLGRWAGGPEADAGRNRSGSATWVNPWTPGGGWRVPRVRTRPVDEARTTAWTSSGVAARGASRDAARRSVGAGYPARGLRIRTSPGASWTCPRANPAPWPWTRSAEPQLPSPTRALRNPKAPAPAPAPPAPPRRAPAPKHPPNPAPPPNSRPPHRRTRPPGTICVSRSSQSRGDRLRGVGSGGDTDGRRTRRRSQGREGVRPEALPLSLSAMTWHDPPSTVSY